MGIRTSLKQWLSDLTGMFFPKLCEVCDTPLVRGEEDLCMKCLYNLPRCNIHNDTFNTIHQRLLRHVPIEKAAAFFYYIRESRYTDLILSAKYRGRPDILRRLASRFAEEIKRDGFFDGVDVVIPVPMHFMKKIRRGYNQTDHIALGISETTGIPVGHHLKATRSHATQTHKNAHERWLNSKNIYQLKDGVDLDGKHILIIDDVITTGATIYACCEAIHNASPTATISILTLAATKLQ